MFMRLCSLIFTNHHIMAPHIDGISSNPWLRSQARNPRPSLQDFCFQNQQGVFRSLIWAKLITTLLHKLTDGFVSSLSPGSFPACSLFYLLLWSSFLLCLWATSAQWANFTQSKKKMRFVVILSSSRTRLYSLQPVAEKPQSTALRTSSSRLTAS